MSLFCAVPCLAQDTEVSGGWQVFAYVYEVLGALLGSGLVWLVAKLSTWIKTKIGNEALGGILARVNETLGNLVVEANQTVVNGLKAAKDPDSPGGTKLTDEEARQIKKEVLAQFKDLWGAKGLALLAKILGFTSDKTESFLSSKIEALVEKEKQKGNPLHP
jgi:prepilin signal peptidase PulO-like enzyme (type II secretory pathway)